MSTAIEVPCTATHCPAPVPTAFVTYTSLLPALRPLRRSLWPHTIDARIFFVVRGPLLRRCPQPPTLRVMATVAPCSRTSAYAATRVAAVRHRGPDKPI